MATIVAKNLSKKFSYYVSCGLFKRRRKTIQALDSISFNIQDGEIMGLVGANGAGKTTLVKIIAGVMKADAGKVLVNGSNPFERSMDYRNRVAIVLGQKGKLHPDMSISESATVYGAMYKLSRDTIDKRLFEFARLLSLSADDLSKQARTLSLGQRMKGELCLSFLNEPEVIYLDEPTLGLDIRSTKCIRQFLKEYCRHHSAVAIITSHNLADIMETSSKLLILNKGKSAFCGNIDELPRVYNDNVCIRYCVDSECTKKKILMHFPNTLERGHELSMTCQPNKVDVVLNCLYSFGEIFELKIEEIPLELIIEDILHAE